MDALNSVEINKIKVNPLSEWKFLLTRTRPPRSTWPRSSSLLCWWCCHSFTNVPAFLPVHAALDPVTREGSFVFTGNFCSWNCVKRYALALEHHKKVPEGCHYIGILAYLTVCKGEPCDDGVMHELGLCNCVVTHRGVTAAPGRETLQAFGGTESIDAYRQYFHRIHNYDAVLHNFATVDQVISLKQQALRSPNSKYWGFHYLHYTGPDTSFSTFVNILPLTNRTFDKHTLVTTGDEAGDGLTRRPTAAKRGGGHNNKDKDGNNGPGGSGLVSKKGGGNSSSPSITTTTHHHHNNKPKARRMSRRNSRIVDHAPASLFLSNSSRAAAAATAALSPSTTDADAAAATEKPIMTAEQVLACNDEQLFYTNSLRGYGNILTSMGIKVSRFKEETTL